MTTRPKKLNKSTVKSYGFMSQIDVEIYDALSDYKIAGDSIYWKKSELSKLKASCNALEREIAQLQNQRAELLNKLHDLFFKKSWHAPSLESVDRAMNAIIEFRKTTAPIDDNGDIAIEEK